MEFVRFAHWAIRPGSTIIKCFHSSCLLPLATMISRFAILLILFPLAIAEAEEIDFAHQIVPLLKQQCGKCHTGNQKEGGFSLNSRESLLKGGESGVAIVAGKTDQGELLARITTDDEFVRMPPEGQPL